MIVRAVHGGLELITQPDHAHLARALMERCVLLEGRERRASILHAIGEHDNGWREEDAAPCIDAATGRVADFVVAPLAVRQRAWPRAIARLAADPWAAALVAQHALTVYDRFRSDAAWASFFADLAARRDAMLRASGRPLDDLAADYVFVRLGDLVSLVFCTGSADEHRFDAWTVRLSGTRVVVTPDPFGGAVVPFAIDAMLLGRQAFESDADLRGALRGARTATCRGEAAGTDPARAREK